MYALEITVHAEKDIAYLKKHGNKSTIRKIENLLMELMEHPQYGTGQVEQLKGDREGQWSRRIDKKNRLVYTIDEDIVTVEVISAMGHYGKK